MQISNKTSVKLPTQQLSWKSYGPKIRYGDDQLINQNPPYQLGASPRNRLTCPINLLLGLWPPNLPFKFFPVILCMGDCIRPPKIVCKSDWFISQDPSDTANNYTPYQLLNFREVRDLARDAQLGPPGTKGYIESINILLVYPVSKVVNTLIT